MITVDKLLEAGIPILGTDELAALKATAALEWMAQNTTLEVDPENQESIVALPAMAKLFVGKYAELLSLKPGVTSQSIEGLSMSFDTTDKGSQLWQLASIYLGSYLRQVRVVPAKRRW